MVTRTDFTFAYANRNALSMLICFGKYSCRDNTVMNQKMPHLNLIIGNKVYSSWSLRGWLAMKHAGLPFEETKLPLDTPEFYSKITHLSPSLCVPALHHDGTVIWDSMAIIDYCARLAPEKFWWPDDTAAYGYARSITAEMHSGFTALRTAAPMQLRSKWSNLTLSSNVQKDVTRIDSLWQECREKFGANGDFLFGEFSAADMMYVPIATRFLTYGIKTSQIAHDYIKAVRNHPFINEWYHDALQETDIVVAGDIPEGAKTLG